ncbi:hypothetical protein [Colwellia sp. MEBiC06753]
MLQHFYSDEAVRYNSIEIAVILQKFRELLEHNQVFNQHFINNCYWIKISESSLVELFPFIEKGKLLRTLYRMKELGLIAQKKDQSNTYWFTVTEVKLQSQAVASQADHQIASQATSQGIPSNHHHQQTTEPAAFTANGFEPAAKRLWSDVDEQFMMESVAKLVQKHGYNQQHFLDIWHTFISTMDANGEQPPARVDLIQKRFVAYANKVQLNMSHANMRYQHSVTQNQQKKDQAVESWLAYINQPREDILCKVDTSQLQTPVLDVWNSFINKSYEKQIPLKHDYQIENGFTNYLRAWVSNESKPQAGKSTYSSRSSYEKLDYNSTSWADDIDLEGL